MTVRSTSRTWLSFLLVVAIALGVFFRLAYLDRKIYWVDETFTSLWLSGYSQPEVVEQIYDRPPVSVEALRKYQHVNEEKTFIDTISQLEPQHPPLYYSLARLWSQHLGNSTASVRLFSAVVSILTIPCLYLLTLELFRSRTTALVAIALFSVSPFHLLYAQEARQYGLWMTTTVISSLLLLRALRIQSLFAWGLYAASVALCLYTSVNSILLVVGYGLYVLLREYQLNRRVVSAIASCLVGAIAYIPWLIQLKQMDFGTVGWTSQSFGWLLLAGKWSANGVRLFFDVFSFDGSTSIRQLLALAPVGIALLVLIGYATYYLVKEAPREVWLFVLTLTLVTFIGLALPDLLIGGRRSGVPRYLIPSLLGIQLIISFLLSNKLALLRSSKHQLWRMVIASLVLAGMASCFTILRADVWWNKGSTYSENIIAIADRINNASNQLVISDADVIPVLSLSHRLEPTVKVFLPSQPSYTRQLVNLNSFDNVYLFQPSSPLKDSIARESGSFRVSALYPQKNPLLWQVVPVATTHESTFQD